MRSHTTAADTSLLSAALIYLTSRAAEMLDRCNLIELDMSSFELSEEDIEAFNVAW